MTTESTHKKNPTLEKVKNIVLVSSGKGGVGKSTVSSSLACVFTQLGKKVGLLDADIYGPNLHSMMGVVDSPLIKEITPGTEMFIPPEAFGVKVMSMGFLVDADQPLIWRGPKLHEVIRQFTHQIYWGELDVLIIDCPPGTGDVHLSLAQYMNISGAVLVSTPSQVSLEDVEKARLMWEKVNVPILGLVENMASFFCPNCDKEHFIFGHKEACEWAQAKGVITLATLPLLTEIREGMDFGKPYQVSHPDSISSKKMKECADLILRKLDALSISSPSIEMGQF